MLPEFAHPAWLALMVVPIVLAVMCIRAARGGRLRQAIADALRASAIAALVIALDF